MTGTMTTAELRTMFRLFPVSRLRRRIAETRETMRHPQRPACAVFLASGPNVTFCARTIACMRAELARREAEKKMQAPAVPFVDLCTATEMGVTSRLSFQIRVF